MQTLKRRPTRDSFFKHGSNFPLSPLPSRRCRGRSQIPRDFALGLCLPFHLPLSPSSFPLRQRWHYHTVPVLSSCDSNPLYEFSWVVCGSKACCISILRSSWHSEIHHAISMPLCTCSVCCRFPLSAATTIQHTQGPGTLSVRCMLGYSRAIMGSCYSTVWECIVCFNVHCIHSI